MNYRLLLRKYMQHVRDCEGVDFVLDVSGHSNVQFTLEEREALQREGRAALAAWQGIGEVAAR